MARASPPAPDPRQALWLRRMRQDLPAAAARHPEWPIRLDHCFARVILDEVCGRPWREVLPAPAWRHLAPAQLEAALSLADAILAGTADLHALNRASLRAREAARVRGAAGVAPVALFDLGRSVSSPPARGNAPGDGAGDS